jgi:dTMP kinase
VTGGRLLVLEGIDGSGKSTQQEPVAEALRARGHDVVVTREPTDGPWGRRIREMARSGERVAPEEELRWFSEDRREHVDTVISPALAAGRVVLSDRYWLSTVAYQGARGLDWREILARSEAEFPVPDLVLLFVIDPELGLERVRARGGAVEHAFERPAYLAKVAEIFAGIDRPYIARLDASPPPESVRVAALARIRERTGLV